MDETQKHRLFCELRYWINNGYTHEDKFTELKNRIAKKRGKESAELLIKRIKWYMAKCNN
jgi:hypothetical protein